ncbi:MAG TPA: VOC family protein [Chitinophaga sp.]|uniref:VOC family protein n=1 Tax=Chitinophaga sp. TaxID=1869181 RepID=UPI002B9EFF45|nr:VOC family protein [Chitinophaga sp.]HVI45389.1 VOC family protein [Chitinophaga sp.]
MTQINAYLTFAGNCREAMSFYRECLGGRLTIQTMGELGGAAKLPAAIRKIVVQATLVSESLVLMGSDMVGEGGLIKGNTVSLMLHCNSEGEARNCYRKLAAGGLATHPLRSNFQGRLFGMLTDRYGHQWLLRCNTIDNSHQTLINNKNQGK